MDLVMTQQRTAECWRSEYCTKSCIFYNNSFPYTPHKRGVVLQLAKEVQSPVHNVTIVTKAW